MRIIDVRSYLSSSRPDVEAALPREAVGDAARRTDDAAQRPVVHVDDPPPAYPAQVDAKLVAPIDMVVDQRREQVVRRSDGVKIAGEVAVDVLHRHNLCVTAAGRDALHDEARTDAGLAQTDRRLPAQAVEARSEEDTAELPYIMR